MPRNISLTELNALCDLLETFKRLNVLEPIDYIVTWEKKPQLTINKLGDFEFTNPQEVYACVITFWGKFAFNPSHTTRFYIDNP